MNIRHKFACASSLWHKVGTKRTTACIVVLAAFGSNAALAAPTVAGNTISWPDDGWYQVQNAATYESVCQGGQSCEVPVGKYIVINHSTGQRFENISVVASSNSATDVTVEGMTISWPDDGWYQVQNAATYQSVCQGGRSCSVPAGKYIVINHSLGKRFENIIVADEAPDLPQDDDPDVGLPDDLPEPQVPVLADPFALPLPLPNPKDPFGSFLEADNEPAVVGGPPSQPKNLRLDLVSNNWAEINWAPANDDGEVVQYTLYRSDGVTYEIRGDQTDPSSSVQNELSKYWLTTSFIDCNYTRFDQLFHRCGSNTPTAGETYTYEVTATDDSGQESAASEPLTITYLENSNAPVPLYDDLYKGANDRFVQNHDLSAVPYWLDEFDLVFSDEFDGDSLDPDKWQTSLTWGDSRIVNREQQYLVNAQRDPDFGYDPFSFTGESLVISAVPTPEELREKLPSVCDEGDATGPERCAFLSGALSSHDKFQFIYGYTEGRFKLSGTSGALSSFYLYHRYAGSGVNYHAPEIDIVEYLGENPYGDPDAFQTHHFGDVNTGITRSAPTMSYKKPDGGNYADNDEWHTFGVLWEPQLVVWYIDGREVKRLFGPQVSRQPMNLVSYLVAGSGWAPTPDLTDPSQFPITMELDYVRVYQRDAFKQTATFGR
ncbi:glycoside hydrolase family 16 protein [Granulosicoccus antarcticus]|uniref:Endo-1,3-1,4-beta-glycanase ExsH n=1 Tax=Granulosicoccus antarcticus IMCC3135 TaxID=1192854 RepID=A0A2Z2NLA2_9GAMM|nr:family 16 glycosylhydrolase [Granulosicoccus antarcticus]ASJ72222.1 Endo-1,3-1,4-beta-glycanase ExsH [Granulosicoccus antarcticus IMCC3135]